MNLIQKFFKISGMKYFIITYGCQMNKSDSERIATILENVGYRAAPKINDADLIVVNMCSVRQSAVDRVFGLLPNFKKLKARNKKLKTVLTGCVLKSDKINFKKGFDLILDIKNLSNWPKLLGFKKYNSGFKNYLEFAPRYKNDFSAFIPISNGCDNACAYCVVPYTRGNLICRTYKEILKEAKNLIKKGFREIWLLGQNVNNYKSNSVNFAKLLKMINAIPGDFWIRFTSPHPKDFSDELIETLAKCKKVTPYLNLPVQSGDNEILKMMNRPYTISQYKNLVKKIRAAFLKYRTGLERKIAISTDIIVGFPGETKKQFENTVKLFKEIKFDMAYIARYSPRPGTPAEKMKNRVSSEEKQRRYEILTRLLKKTSLEKTKKTSGKKWKF